MNKPLGSIDEWGNCIKDAIGHDKIQHTCDMCKLKFDAEYIVFKDNLLHPIYNDSELKIDIRKGNRKTLVSLNMCPECTEKLLGLLDKHFPRLNLEDEL